MLQKPEGQRPKRRLLTASALVVVIYFGGLLIVPPAAVGYFGNDLVILQPASHIEIYLYRPILRLPIVGDAYAWWVIKICKATETCTYPYQPPA